MRWFVDISSIGSGGKASRFCVEAEQWQRALQSVRGIRGDTTPFSNFSIELLDDGYRAIDPATRTRFVVQKAPDGAELTTNPIEVQGIPSVPPPAAPAKASDPQRRVSERRRGRGAAPIPADAVPAAPPPRPNGSAATSAPAS